jgi:signal transduction histidine kinase
MSVGTAADEAGMLLLLEPPEKCARIRPIAPSARLTVLFLLLIGMGGMTYVSWRDAQAAFAQRKTTTESLLHLEQALSLLKDAETGQRGFLLTRDPKYLHPYLAGRRDFQAEYDAVGLALRGDLSAEAILLRLGPLVAKKMDTMGETIRSTQAGAAAQGLAEMRTGQGRELMDAIRELHEQLGLLVTARARAADVKALERSRRSLWEMALLTALSFGGVAFFMARAARFEGSLLQRSALMEVEVLQRTEAEGEARRLNRELLASNQELEAFAYSVTHDLRAPLRHMDGFARLLRKGVQEVAPPKAMHQLDVIQASAQRMGDLIDDLLTYSRLGRTELHKVPVPLATLLGQVRLDLAEAETDRNVVWRISPLPTVVGDPTLLRLVLQNLLSNALKFTRHRDPAIIEVGSQVEAGITLSVRDNGTGFDMRFLDKLFKPFQRLHSQEAFEGTGIGLANVERVAARHGGRAWAEGTPDQGAVFYLFIPSEG